MTIHELSPDGRALLRLAALELAMKMSGRRDTAVQAEAYARWAAGEGGTIDEIADKVEKLGAN